MKVFFTLIFATLLFSCVSENEEELFAEEQEPIPVDEINFQVDVLPLIQTNCTDKNCHVPRGTRASTLLTNYQEIKTAVDNKQLRNEVVTAQMPLGTSMAQSSINLIVDWIDNGAKQN